MVKTDIFWSWFKEHSVDYLHLNDNDTNEEKKEELLDGLLEELHRYCNQLYFEIGGAPGEDQELVITAEGKVDYFKNVEELVNRAPHIENWNFTAFLQPQDLDYTSNFGDVELKPGDTWFLPLNSKSKPMSIGLRICVPNYEILKDSKWLKAAVFKILDHVLGEESFALDVNHVEISNLPENPEDKGMMELKDLKAFIKWKKSKLSSIKNDSDL